MFISASTTLIARFRALSRRTGFVTVITVLAPTLAQAQITNRVIVPSTAFGAITVIDTATNTIVGTPANAFGANDAAVTLDGRSILVVNANLSTVTRYALDPLTGAPTDVFNVGLDAAGIAITPDGRKAYVSCAGEVDVLDLTTMTVATAIPVASALPGGIAISTDGTQVYVPEGDLDDVVVIDVATDAIVGSPIAVGSGPVGVATTAGGVVLVSNFNDTRCR